MATKTQVTDGGSEITGTLKLQNQTVHPILVSAPTTRLSVSAGGITCIIDDISTSGWLGADPQPDGGAALTFAVWIEAANFTEQGHYFIYVNDASDDDFEVDFSFAITGRQIWRTESHSPGVGRDASPVFADEVTETDAWQTIDPPSWTITLGSLSWSAEQVEPPPYEGSAVGNVAFNINQHKGNSGVIYAQVKDVKWDDADLALLRYEYPSPKPVSGVYLDGKVGGFDVECVSNSSLDRTVAHGRPLIVDFSDFGIYDRDGNLMNSVRIDGGFRANNHYPETLGWSTTP